MEITSELPFCLGDGIRPSSKFNSGSFKNCSFIFARFIASVQTIFMLALCPRITGTLTHVAIVVTSENFSILFNSSFILVSSPVLPSV
jgi:hypothetical protein